MKVMMQYKYSDFINFFGEIMTYPKAYEPEFGYMYQLLTRNENNKGVWEHCDYAKDKQEKDYLISQYKLAYRNEASTEFKVIILPQKYWQIKN